jgi:hypothetical protein
MNFTTLDDAVATFQAHRAGLLAKGVSWSNPGLEPVGYLPEFLRNDTDMALDALMALDTVANIPTLSLDPNSGVPSLLTTLIDPQVYEVLFAPNMAAEILGEVRKGTWLDETTLFPVAEATGEVSSYGDYATSGRSGVDTNWPQVQAYLFQTIKEYGERELERAGLARINWVSEIDRAAAINLNKFSNYTYFFGVMALQNYGLINNPFLSAYLTPAPKAATPGSTAWTNAQGQVVASANEVFNDTQSLYLQLVAQNAGLVKADTKMTLALGPTSAVALTATNTFNVNVNDLLMKNFKNLKIKEAVQYQGKSGQNPQGVAGGNVVQLIADEVEGQKTAFCAYNEKMRAHPIIREMSAFRQKVTSGTWGTVMRYPAGISQMIGI